MRLGSFLLRLATAISFCLVAGLPEPAQAQDTNPPKTVKRPGGRPGSQSAILTGPADPQETTPPITVKRRDDLTDEDLRKQLLSVPEIGFAQGTAAFIYKALQEGDQRASSLPPDYGQKNFKALTIRLRQPEQFALPWRQEPDCTLGKEDGERFHVLSLHIRNCLTSSVPSGDVRPDPQKAQAMLAGDRDKAKELKTPQAVPVLMQLLQTENAASRQLLVEMLSRIEGKESSVALAQRSLFDLSADVREKALRALSKRPGKEFQAVLVEGLRFPWPAAADHAAEAIAALQLDLVSELVQMLKEPSPTLPVKKNDREYVTKELVRINHLSNCLLCHPPSFAKNDLVRGRMPMPGEDPPPLYYNASRGLFVRAITTYLRQDFSVVQPVAQPVKWPANQRFDYLVRTRRLTPKEVRTFQTAEKKDPEKTDSEKYPQREAVLFTLRQLAGKDVGPTYEAWAKELPSLIRITRDKGK